jgi:hypothetical protein
MAEDFDWSLPGLNQRNFIALGNLLALRNGGQVEPAFVTCESQLQDENESSDDSDAGSIDTSRPCKISNSGHRGLKKSFWTAWQNWPPMKRAADPLLARA